MKLRILLGAALLALPLATARAQEIAITFDDLPAHSSLPPGVTRMEIANDIIAGLQAAKAPPTYGFVNAMYVARDPSLVKVLEAWRAAGFPLGNHGFSHLNLNSVSEAEWEADVLKDEPYLQPLMKDADYKWLRFPFLAEGNTPEKRAAVRVFLHEHGYRIAGVTMSFGDYAYNGAYARCVEKKDTAAIAKMEDAYLAGAAAALERSQAISKGVYGHDIPFILLMHLGAFDARMIGRLMAFYKAQGVRFVSLEEASKDPFYRWDTDLSRPPGVDSLEAVAGGAKMSLPKSTAPQLDLEKLCR